MIVWNLWFVARSTSLATPATAWSTFSSICCQGDLPSLSAAAQLEGWEVGSVATQLEETGDVAFVFFGRKQISSRRESRWRIFTGNSSIFLSFFAVERTWFLVKMFMEKVTTALPLSHQAHIVRYDVSADGTSWLTAVSFSFTSCRVTSIPGGGCLLLDCTLITILTPPLLHWPNTTSGIEHLKMVFEYNVQSVARIFNYIQARRRKEIFPRKKAA